MEFSEQKRIVKTKNVRTVERKEKERRERERRKEGKKEKAEVSIFLSEKVDFIIKNKYRTFYSDKDVTI